MKKILGVVIIIAVIAVAAMFLMPSKEKQEGTENQVQKEEIVQNGEQSQTTTSNFSAIEKAEDLSKIIDDVYAAQTMEMPLLQTQEIDVTDKDMVSYVTGLENGEDLEYAVASEPMMSSQAYSFVLVKVKEGANAEKVAKEMCDNIDERKWICVTAEKIYATNSGQVVCLIMSNEETATAIYDEFKELAGEVGKEFTRTAEEPELPEDMY